MVEVFVPEVSGKASLKDSVVGILIRKWPLNAQKIFNELKKQNSFSGSYQAVHKALNSLLDQGVLEKESNEYRLSKEWIEKLRIFSTQLEESYVSSAPLFVDDHTSKLSFESLWHLYQFMLNAFESGFFHKGKSEIGCAQLLHMWHWFPLAGSKKEYEQLVRIASSTPAFIVSAKDTVVDKWIADYYRSVGWKVKLGVPSVKDFDLFVHGDSVIQVYFPEEIKKDLEKTFSKLKSVSQLKISEFFENVFHKKTNITVVVIRDEKLALESYNKIKSYFT